ncbi:MAG: hypothetical protein GWN67_24895 [Phycisphaerae bacterium]|nr:hypothetical protein [Phycisphaerae bacterium]NIP55360.1 hypothetical protein [Phycisphaerae bacterium]NIS54129.1 hypothetical protein [Phycisphaerae bacterium]NIU11681.1 hypothetical protein [Phycisphaerae bacterium]NIU59503.1 hypothetical protein [Phycisphaerae bacterium]
MVIEELKEAPDLAQENEDIKIRCPSFKISKTHRLSFFTKRFSTRRGLSNATEEEFIGYAIVKQDAIPDYGRVTRIYESVIKPSRYVNNFIKGDKEWTCSIVGNLFKVKGYIYAQQNAITNVCAHVALRTAASCFHKDEDMLYREMNELIGIDHVKRKLEPGKGLDTMEMVEILSKAGASCIVADYTNPKRHKNRAPFQKLVYGSIESGFPAIVIFETAENTDVCHAIPIFGHTFNDDTWVYKAELSYFKVGSGMHYIPSESWTSTYIAHDDNYGSNFCIPRMYLHVRRYCNAQNNEVKGCSMDYGNVCYVIGTLPREVRMNAIQAEVIGADYLFTILPQLPNLSDVWPTRLCYYAGVNQLVLRPILIRSDDYSRHLSNIRGWKRKKFEFEIEIEPEGWLWLIELSVPELFSSNKRKIAEVVLRSDVEPKSQRDFNSFLLARVPGYFALYSGGQASNPNYNFIPSGIVDHVELYGCEESM